MMTEIFDKVWTSSLLSLKKKNVNNVVVIVIYNVSRLLVFHLTGFGGWADGRKQNLVQWTVMSSSKSIEKEIALNKQ